MKYRKRIRDELDVCKYYTHKDKTDDLPLFVPMWTVKGPIQVPEETCLEYYPSYNKSRMVGDCFSVLRKLSSIYFN